MAINLSPAETSIFRIVQAVRQILQGRDSASGVVTLAVSAASTTVKVPNVAPTSNILLSPASAAAAAEWQNGTIYVLQSGVTQGQFVINHANNATAGRAVFWAARG